jgi:hypothetical protein
MSIAQLPGGNPINLSGGSGTQTFSKIGVSAEKNIVHIFGENINSPPDFEAGDLLEYSGFPENGDFATEENTGSYFFFVQEKLDDRNYRLTQQLVPDGLTAATAGISAEQLKIDNGYNTNDVYWIDLPTVGPTQVYCIMDSAVNGGGWMMMMKATRGTTFNWNSSYWTQNNTLNTTQTNRNDGDAKFEVMNRFEAKDMLALWPDIGQGGSLSISGYPWIWLENNFFNGTRIVPITFWSGNDRFFKRDALNFTGWGSPWSTQTDVRFYGFNYRNNGGWARTRWGFGWNENGGGLFPNGDMNSDDVSGGIGMMPNFGSFSAGDRINCCQNRTGINRSARVEVYVR